MYRHVLPEEHRRRRPAACSFPLLCLTALLCLLPAVAFGGPVSNGKHDFTDNGFTGGGVCAECHVPHRAVADRLYPRVGNVAVFSTAPARLCMDCHYDVAPVDGWGVLPTGAGWTGVPTTLKPPAYPHSGATYSPCTKCHKHSNDFAGGADNSCLCCHTTEACGGPLTDADQSGRDTGDGDARVDKFFRGIGCLDDAAILSQHNIRYVVADCDLSTSDTVADDECKKCHGLKHPNATQFLVYPATWGTYTAGIAIPKGDMPTYQGFCLACHDGMDSAPWESNGTKFAGTISSSQVAPSSRSDPASLQGTAPWVVPAVPPKTPAGVVRGTPFFPFYETNGHGGQTALIKATAMNVTCLAGGTGAQGCHTVHGSPNRYLIASGALSTAPIPPATAVRTIGTAIDSATEFGTGVCYACHVVGVNFSRADSVSIFHGWFGNSTVLHDNATGPTPVLDGMAPMRWLPFDASNAYSMNITGWRTAVGAMPFYAGNGESNKIHQRTYPGVLSASHWMHCLTCHDPHGTGLGGTGTLPPDEPGMLRRYPNTHGYDDLLCGQCHVK